MSYLEIKKFPDSVLRKVAAPVRRIDRQIESFVDALIRKMKNQPGGIGIAATQVGVLKQVAIVDVSPKIEGKKLMVLINPVILAAEETNTFREGCMSLPDYTANVRRAEHIALQYQDLRLKTHVIRTSGLEARCVQHEVDHLAGMLFIDRVSSLKRDVFTRKRYL